MGVLEMLDFFPFGYWVKSVKCSCIMHTIADKLCFSQGHMMNHGKIHRTDQIGPDKNIPRREGKNNDVQVT